MNLHFQVPRRAALGALVGCALTATLAARVEAGVPSLTRSSWRLSEPTVGCHYRFRADGGLDVLTLYVTLRTELDVPAPDCESSVTVSLVGPPPSGGDCGHAASVGSALCSCCPLSRSAVSAVDGTFAVTFARLGGRGTAQVCVTALCLGTNEEICCEEFAFTSPDLDGTCQTFGSSTSIIDFGIWAGCYSPNPPCNAADYNCDCQVGVLDVAIYAGGLGLNCGGASCP